MHSTYDDDSWKFTTISEDTQGHEKITFGDNECGKVEGVGNIVSQDHILSNVLLVESLNFNLLSMAQLCDRGFKVTFTNEGMEVTRKYNNDIIFKGFRYHNLYLLDFSSKEANLTTCLFTKTS